MGDTTISIRLSVFLATVLIGVLLRLPNCAHAEPFVSDWTYRHELDVSQRINLLGHDAQRASACYVAITIYSIKMKKSDLLQYSDVGRRVAAEFRDFYVRITDDPDTLRLLYWQSMRLYNEGSVTWDEMESTAIECGGWMDTMKDKGRSLAEVIKETNAYQSMAVDLDDHSAEYCAALLDLASYDDETYPGREGMREEILHRHWFEGRPGFDPKLASKFTHMVIAGMQAQDYNWNEVMTAARECVSSMWEVRREKAAGAATR